MIAGALTAIKGLCDMVPGWVWALLLAGAALTNCHTANQRDAAVRKHDHLVAVTAQEKADRETLAAADARQVKKLQENHAAKQQEKTDGYVKKIADLRVAAAGDAGRIERLRNDIADANRDRREAEGDATTCRGERDRLQLVEGLVGEGFELVVQGRERVRERDAQVEYLKGIVSNDRTLTGDSQ